MKQFKGKKVFIRTVTHYYTGEVEKIDSGMIMLKNAAWIADTGRFHNALKTGNLNEVEPFVDPVGIPLGAIVDITTWRHALPLTQK